MDRVPLRRYEQTLDLDDEEVRGGYRDGRNNEPEPGHNRSFAHWHGWRNGMVDGHHMESDEAMRELAKDALDHPLSPIRRGWRQPGHNGLESRWAALTA